MWVYFAGAGMAGGIGNGGMIGRSHATITSVDLRFPKTSNNDSGRRDTYRNDETSARSISAKTFVWEWVYYKRKVTNGGKTTHRPIYRTRSTEGTNWLAAEQDMHGTREVRDRLIVPEPADFEAYGTLRRQETLRLNESNTLNKPKQRFTDVDLIEPAAWALTSL